MVEVHRFHIDGPLLIQPPLFPDERGCFCQIYQRNAYTKAGISLEFVQDNFSLSKQGVIRGLHYQSAPGQAKLVTVVYGSIWDVAVDLRPDSPTYGSWVGVELNDDKQSQLFIPIGFAHGFCVLSREARVYYKVSAPFDPARECSIRWDDPDLKISWPVVNPIISQRDQLASSFAHFARMNVDSGLSNSIR